ncbi:MAG: Na/Pi cotransporter family protein, partial [Mesorhizobium sp.]
VMLILFMIFRPHFSFLGTTASGQIVNAHILFNVIILLAGLPLAGLVYRASEKIVALGTKPEPAAALDVVELSALNESALDTPSQALANATREVVRVCETVEIMLKRIIELYESADAGKIKALAALDDRVDQKHAAIKLYLAKVTKNPLSEDEALRCQELIGACVKLEQVGDIIVRNMLVHVRKKLERGLEFTP